MNPVTHPPAQQLRPSKGTKDPSERLARIILLEQEVRKAESLQPLAFLMANETYRIVPFFQSVCWKRTQAGGIQLVAVSGVSEIDPRSPTVVSIRKVIASLVRSKQSHELHQVHRHKQSEAVQEEWSQWMPDVGFWCPLVSRTGAVDAGVFLVREEAFSGQESKSLQALVDAYRHAWYTLPGGTPTRKGRVGQFLLSVRGRVLILCLLIAGLCLPVRESALAPASIVPFQPIIVTAPIEGVIERFAVTPNQHVIQDQALFSFVDTELRSDFDVAENQLASVKEEYMRMAQKAFSDEDAKSQVELYKAKHEQKVLERRLALSRLERTKVTAETAGIAVFADEHKWIGRPVKVGEKILTLANPNQSEIEIWMAVEDGIALEPGADVKMFLNTDPTTPISGMIRQTSYEPEMTPDGILAFRLKARISDQTVVPLRIGWKGTAKIFSHQRVSMFYYLMRRPISTMRQVVGL